MPGKGCCVITCHNYIYKTKNSDDEKINKIIYHRFPKDETVRKKWMHLSGKEGIWNPNNACICSEHFTEDDYERDLKAELLNIPNKRRLKPTSVPSLQLPSEKILSSLNTTRSAKHIRKRKEAFASQLELAPKAIKIEKENSSDENDILNDEKPQKTKPSILKRRGRPAKRARLQEKSENNKIENEKNDKEKNVQEERQQELEEIKQKYELLLKKNEDLMVKNLKLERELEIKKIEEDQKERDRLELEKQNSEYQNLTKKHTELSRKKEELLKRNEDLNIQISRLKFIDKENKHKILQLQNEFKKKTAKTDDCIEKLKETFTKNQIDILLKEKSKVPWTAEEISQAFTIRYYSKRCYNYLRLKLNYPLPGLTTLKNWSSNFIGKQGIINENFEALANQSLPETEQLVILKHNVIKGCSENDQVNEKLARPYTRVQVVEAQALFGDWKHIVYVDFEKELTKKELLYIVKNFENINFSVVAFVSDCGSQKLWTELDISIEQRKTYFSNPYTQEKIYLFVDTSHLLRLLRNWFLDSGFTWENVKNINLEHIETLLFMNKNGELGNFHLTSKHIRCLGVARRVHHLATELLSHNTAEAIKKYLPDDPQVTETADFISLICNWYNIFTSTELEDLENPFRSAFGLYLNDQLEILETFYNEILNMRCGTRENPMIFQKGILISINSLISLQQECQEKYNKNYILTSKLQQNTLETLFENLSENKDQDPNHCLQKLRLVLMAKLQNRNYTKPVTKKPKKKSVLSKKVKPQIEKSQELIKEKVQNITTTQRVLLPKNTKLVSIGNQLVFTPNILTISPTNVSRIENMTPVKNISQVHTMIDEGKTMNEKESEKGLRKEFVFAMVDNQFVLKENVIYTTENYPIQNIEFSSEKSEKNIGIKSEVRFNNEVNQNEINSNILVQNCLEGVKKEQTVPVTSEIVKIQTKSDNSDANDLDNNGDDVSEIELQNEENCLKTTEINNFLPKNKGISTKRLVGAPKHISFESATSDKNELTTILVLENSELNSELISNNSKSVPNESSIKNKGITSSAKHVSFDNVTNKTTHSNNISPILLLQTDKNNTSEINSSVFLNESDNFTFVNNESENIRNDINVSTENIEELEPKTRWPSLSTENKMADDEQNDSSLYLEENINEFCESENKLNDNNCITIKMDGTDTNELSEDLITQVLQSAGINVDSMQPGEYVEVVFENDNRVRIVQSNE